MKKKRSLFILNSEVFFNLNEIPKLNHLNFKNPTNSNTVYVGNLSFHTREEQIWELFFRIGNIKRIIIGLNRYNYTPCGFCFIEFYNLIDAKNCVFFFRGFKIEKRVIKIELDPGFSNGRQFGRGKRGGQTQDERERKIKKFII
ncbi:ncbP2 (nucleomorph) [Hemiselmis andersenii]|uniref:Nuclear cap-binding protein subunit 2 n=1 Tax=Hemiselmis andersenii TaxID=464988 RepID=A9BKB1_HEMAN|nr:ncbP2 [Hemiselmis andersenii]ABW97944.1 ncbP2 [Hemiselmis andersenii]|mmetsp:Transcript_28394/g.66372  ORF Transcript_28394/g.66372 Transcript_28394/m.66372 type:complete len:144 (-) Transcript_28394:451-882(-)